MIIKLNITGMPTVRLELVSELTQQLHVSRKKDKYDRRVTTSWVTGITTVTLQRYHSNKNSKDVDGLIYVGRSFQQYMDKFDEAFGFRLAGVRAFAKLFAVNGKSEIEATKLAERVMDTVIANKDQANVAFSDEVATAPAESVKDTSAKKRGRKAKAEVKAVAAPARKRGRPSKAVKASAKSVAAPARKRGRPRKQPV